MINCDGDPVSSSQSRGAWSCRHHERLIKIERPVGRRGVSRRPLGYVAAHSDDARPLPTPRRGAPAGPADPLRMTSSHHRPTFEEFLRWSDRAPCVPVYRQLTGDGLTPVSAFRRIERTAPSFLFESVIGGEKVGRSASLAPSRSSHFEARGDELP